MPLIHQKSDTELWMLLRKGNKIAFSILYKRHIQSLFHFGQKLTTDQELIKDVLQELFTEFWTKRGHLSDVKQVKVYLIKSFRYKLLRTISKANKTPIYNLDDLLKDIPEEEILENELAIERREMLKQKLKDLPERQREVIHLRYFQNLKNDEIAEVISVNYQSVSNLLQRALKNLKKKITRGKAKFPLLFLF